MAMSGRSVGKSRKRRRKSRHGAGTGSPERQMRTFRWGAGVLLVLLLPFAASCNLEEFAISLKTIARGLGGESSLAKAESGFLPGSEGDAALRRDIVSYLRLHRTGLSRLEEVMLADGILKIARDSKTDYRLILALIKVESRFSNWATSSKGAMGLMQVMPSTGRRMARELHVPWAGTASLFDPVTNVHIGAAYLAKLRSQFGDLGTALMAYNRGPGALQNLGAIDPSSDGYVSKVMGHYHRLRYSSALADAGDRRTAPAA